MKYALFSDVVEGPSIFNRLLPCILSHGSLHEVIVNSQCEPSVSANQEQRLGMRTFALLVPRDEIKLNPVWKLGAGK